MSDPFGPQYAASYDALYADKDYDTEVDLLEEIFRRSGRKVRTVLDLGCGTGAHTVRLARRGYEVVGVDLSDNMLEGARRRAQNAAPLTAEFVRGDIRSVRLDRQFDAVICMFAVLGYQTLDEDVTRALATVRSHLANGGPFAFDVWYGPAVEAIGPSNRSRQVVTSDEQIERRASAALDRGKHLCTVDYQLTSRRVGRGDVLTHETHQVRYFFHGELDRLLRAAHLSLIELVPFPDVSAPLSAETWNALGIARG